MKFEWDQKKNRSNIKKHGVSFENASCVFNDPYALSIVDIEHSDEEERWVLLGKSNELITLVVVHTFRNTEGIEYVRIISARKATKHEEKIYSERRSK